MNFDVIEFSYVSMCSLLKVANRRPINLISPFLLHIEQITSIGSTGDNSSLLACFCSIVHVLSASSAVFTCFQHFTNLAIYNAMRRVGSHLQHTPTHLQHIVDVEHDNCGLFAHI